LDAPFWLVGKLPASENKMATRKGRNNPGELRAKKLEAITS
jgi:hypothetical protein